jgi:uncharacterized membrane protein YqjE
VTNGEANPPTDPPGSGPGGAGPAGATRVAPVKEAADGAKSPEEMTVGELVFEVSDRASVLVREEIELAKTEVMEKVNRLLRGSVVGLAAGVFVLLALAMIMHAVAWGINDLFFGDDVWAGFLIEAVVFLLIAAGAGLFAYRSFKRGAPPTPDMAIEEAKEIRAAFESEEEATS